MLTELSQIWECFNYIDCSNKVDLTNTAATIIGIIKGSVNVKKHFYIRRENRFIIMFA